MPKGFYLLLLILPLRSIAQDLKVVSLKCEYKKDPQGIEATSPHLSWQLHSTRYNVMQTAYRVLVADDAMKLRHNIGNVWDSKKTTSSASIQIAYTGRLLQASKTYYWKVMVWVSHRKSPVWSSIANWQMGLLTNADWNGAAWIAYNKMPDSLYMVPAIPGKGPKKLGYANDTLPLIRKTFTVEGPLKKATLFICGLGHFDVSLNGKKIGDHFLDPGWVKYDKQALYVPFDLTDQLKQGKNSIGVMLGNGFYYIPRDKRYRKLTGAYGYPKMICRLVFEYKNGRVASLVSGPDWKTARSPIIFTGIYAGEDYDANLEQPGWNTAGFNDADWRKVMIVDGPPALKSQMADPLKVMQEFAPQSKKELSNGAWIYDLGQNSSGIPQITVRGKKGDTVRIIPAELVKADGSASQKASGGPHYYNYILKGNDDETWHPQFTYYGFRYLQVEGAVPQNEANPGHLPVIMDVRGLHTRNAADKVGSFSCSNELFNRTFELIDWAIRSNMVSIFTDCPHREKLGWLEEAHLMGNSLQYNYDIHQLALKCINDMRIAQTKEGLIPEIAPEFVKFDKPFRDSPEWGSNGVILPWYVYQWYGDRSVLAQSYDMIRRYLEYLGKESANAILCQGLGDWYDLGPGAPGYSQLTPKGITATAIYYYDLNIAAKIAGVLGKQADAMSYKKTAEVVRKAYNDAFFNPETKEYGTGSQTANAMSVYMGLVKPGYRADVVKNIVKDISEHGNRLTAGDIGYRYLLKVLDDADRSDVIFDINNRYDVPGYGYQITHGATSLTESWAALPTVSNNHFMLGHIMEWFYAGLAGIRPASEAVAFNKIEIRPEVVGDLKYVNASYISPYGLIASNWKKSKDQFELNASIPPNTTAAIYLPASKEATVTQNGRPVRIIKYGNGKVLLKVGSGSYNFIVKN